MKRKGQIMTVDFVFSLILLMLALGYTFRIAEANEYRLKEEQMFNDLQRIGSAASELMVASPDFTCEATMGGSTQYFSHCVNRNKLSNATEDELGIPAGSNYHFEILINDVHLTGDNAPDPSNAGNTDARFIYSEERTAILNNGNPALATIEACFDGGACALTTRDIMIKLWKT